MRFLLDTNICIYIIKRKPEKVFSRFRASPVGSIGISVITYSELCHGVKKSRHAKQNASALEAFVSPLEILPYTADIANTYGEIRTDLEGRGQTIGPLDMLIAAHARSLELVLVTNNEKEFQRVQALRVENWT